MSSGVFHGGLTNRGIAAYALALLLTAFYVVIYFGSDLTLPGVLRGIAGEATVGAFFQRTVYSGLDPLSQALRGQQADGWFFYGTLYTVLVLIFGARMIFIHRRNPYHIVRTISLMFFQLCFAYIVPGILLRFHQPEFYFSYFWPLKYDYLQPSTWQYLTGSFGTVGALFLAFAALMTFVGSPLLTYFFGKRWYCSWVCGCGALANTAGDPFRHLSDKSEGAWKLERRLIYPILGFIIVVTVLLWINSLTGGGVFGTVSGTLAKAYGFFIGAIFSGVIGVGAYPLLGTRVWCRFGCPMAAVLGLQQRLFSRFRITTNGGQCISCGNCSTYCEMGIDVRGYAQRGENIVRASCVGCGMCATVCPRGVLKLENGPVAGRVP